MKKKLVKNRELRKVPKIEKVKKDFLKDKEKEKQKEKKGLLKVKKAQQKVKAAAKHYGVEAWRRVLDEYEPQAGGRHTAMLLALLGLLYFYHQH